jgi:hypothetical protein
MQYEVVICSGCGVTVVAFLCGFIGAVKFSSPTNHQPTNQPTNQSINQASPRAIHPSIHPSIHLFIDRIHPLLSSIGLVNALCLPACVLLIAASLRLNHPASQPTNQRNQRAIHPSIHPSIHQQLSSIAAFHWVGQRSLPSRVCSPDYRFPTLEPTGQPTNQRNQ